MRALAVRSGYLLAGGSFINASGVAVPSLAQWDGSHWAGVPAAGGPYFGETQVAALFSTCQFSYTGPACDRCALGYFGRSCQHRCAACVHGACTDGMVGGCACSAGWTGTLCDTVTDDGGGDDDGLDDPADGEVNSATVIVAVVLRAAVVAIIIAAIALVVAARTRAHAKAEAHEDAPLLKSAPVPTTPATTVTTSSTSDAGTIAAV